MSRDTYIFFASLDTCSDLKLLSKVFIFSAVDFILS